VETFPSCVFTESTTEKSIDDTTAEQDQLSEPLETTTSVIDDDTTTADAVTSASDTSTGEFVITGVCIAVV